MPNNSRPHIPSVSAHPEPLDKPDLSLFAPTSFEEVDFPVEASYTNLSNQHMQIIGWQWHEEVEFFMVESGQVHLALSSQRMLISPGGCVFLNHNQLHSLQAVDGEPCILHILKFHPSFLFGYGKTQFSAKYLSPVLCSPTLQYLHIKNSSAAQRKILALVKSTWNICQEKNFGYELQVKSNLCLLWLQLLSFSQADLNTTLSVEQFSLDNSRVKQAILYIEAHHTEALTLEEIAASVHISKSECCRCFKRTLGLTPFEYLIKYRIFESTRKIMRGEDVANSISDLAASVGFNNVSYYNKLFKKLVHCTPTEYRKSLQYVPAQNYFT